VCDKTTKDYGGKKHTYHEYGTLISDVWRDLECDLEEDISPVVSRLADLFGGKPYNEIVVLDLRNLHKKRESSKDPALDTKEKRLPSHLTNKIVTGDCLYELRKIPSNSVDFAFADPPYNLGKGYLGYTDDLKVKEYFGWCHKWIFEMARVLKPGRTFSVLNIPLWAIRHFQFAKTFLRYQNWIVWDALAFPVRLIMPAHYSILCFSKGKPRELPGPVNHQVEIALPSAPKTFRALEPLADGYCLRSDCSEWRQRAVINDRGSLADFWSDIHRLKHNSRRVDHPCQLPAHLMFRLITIFTNPDELVLDCFNGAGTTTLAAHLLNRRYFGIEKSKEYCGMARKRHAEISRGLDPFRKEDRILKAKNSPVPRLLKQKYKIPKKTLQMEVKRIAIKLGRIPNREELKEYGKFSIDYYDRYFVSWGEVIAAARTTGMRETRTLIGDALVSNGKQLVLELNAKDH